jgi:phage protein D
MESVLETMQRQAADVRKRWSKNVNAVNEARNKAGLEKMDDWRATTLSSVLETFARRTEAYDAVTKIGGRSANEAQTQPSDVSFIRKHGINILTAAVPNFIAHD